MNTLSGFFMAALLGATLATNSARAQTYGITLPYVDTSNIDDSKETCANLCRRVKSPGLLRWENDDLTCAPGFFGPNFQDVKLDPLIIHNASKSSMFQSALAASSSADGELQRQRAELTTATKAVEEFERQHKEIADRLKLATDSKEGLDRNYVVKALTLSAKNTPENQKAFDQAKQKRDDNDKQIESLTAETTTFWLKPDAFNAVAKKQDLEKAVNAIQVRDFVMVRREAAARVCQSAFQNAGVNSAKEKVDVKSAHEVHHEVQCTCVGAIR